jgi:hypothetical protein
VSFSFDAGDLTRSLAEDVKRIANEELAKRERAERAFHDRQKGRPVADIQRDYEAEFGTKLSEQDARLASDGVPVQVTKKVIR